jgi:hypothetical protein
MEFWLTISEDETHLNWSALGAELRGAAIDAMGADHLPSVETAYDFLLANPECFGREEWPAGMPDAPGIALIAAYYAFDEPAACQPGEADV